MDSLTHLFYGGAIAAAIAPARHRRGALLAGATLNTLPDLDVIPLAMFGDAVAQMTSHRGATHSLIVLPFAAWAIWAFFRGRGGRVAAEPRRWFWAIQACLLAHPLIDAFTVYGTQLLWPLPVAPTMWSSLFMIDPLFTLPWLAGCLVAWIARERAVAQRALTVALALGLAYVGWSLVAKHLVDRQAERALAALGHPDAPRFSVPQPFNTLLWRVVAMTPDGYLEGERSLVADHGPMAFRAYRSDHAALDAVRGFPAVARLLWFNHHFAKAETRDGRLLLSDLRMGSEPDYAFRFAVAERAGADWRAIPPQQAPFQWRSRRDLASLWRRIWRPARTQAAAGSSGATPAISESK